ncbi:MAG: hypothetical protein EBZ91_04595 [Gammaproteobacteria bacterium]|nr:hypothetical protein [Gammaproteobacteria bacterium]
MRATVSEQNSSMLRAERIDGRPASRSAEPAATISQLPNNQCSQKRGHDSASSTGPKPMNRPRPTMRLSHTRPNCSISSSAATSNPRVRHSRQHHNHKTA